MHTPGPVGLLGVLAAQRLGLPLVQTYHTDLHAYAEAYRFPARALRAGVRLYARRLGVPGLSRRRPRQGRRRPRRQRAATGRNVLLLGDCDARGRADPGGAGPHPAAGAADERIFLVPTGVAARPTTPAAVAAFRRPVWR